VFAVPKSIAISLEKMLKSRLAGKNFMVIPLLTV